MMRRPGDTFVVPDDDNATEHRGHTVTVVAIEPNQHWAAIRCSCGEDFVVDEDEE